jgi:hypothetical protein
MFTRLAKFRLLRPRSIAPGLQGAMPANDNLSNALRPRGPQRIRSQALVCHWSLTDGGTRLGCRWQPEAPARTVLEDPDSEWMSNKTLEPQATQLDRRHSLPHFALTVGT